MTHPATGSVRGPGRVIRCGRVEPRARGPAVREGAVGTPGPETRSPISGRSWLVEPRAHLPGESPRHRAVHGRRHGPPVAHRLRLPARPPRPPRRPAAAPGAPGVRPPDPRPRLHAAPDDGSRPGAERAGPSGPPGLHPPDAPARPRVRPPEPAPERLPALLHDGHARRDPDPGPPPAQGPAPPAEQHLALPAPRWRPPGRG